MYVRVAGDDEPNDEWVMPFADAFDDETEAFPYGTYGHTAPMVSKVCGCMCCVLTFSHYLNIAVRQLR